VVQWEFLETKELVGKEDNKDPSMIHVQRGQNIGDQMVKMDGPLMK